MRGAVEREKREHRNRTWSAWHIAALTRAKKMPKLSQILPKERKRQSIAQMVEAAREIHAAVKSKGK